MKRGTKRRQLLDGLAMTVNGQWPLHWLKLSFQHLASRMQNEGLVRIIKNDPFVGDHPYVRITKAGRKAVRK